ncbi:MAG: hypothetical protein CML03_01090, partial [Pseudooceanicola sp.]|nr:hypothetical protein [Pseudooceanicola sp.]
YGNALAGLATNNANNVANMQANQGNAIGNIEIGQGNTQAQLAQNYGNALAGGDLYAANNTDPWAQGIMAGAQMYMGGGSNWGSVLGGAQQAPAQNAGSQATFNRNLNNAMYF